MSSNTTTPSTKYADLITRDEKTVKADEVSLTVETAKLQIEADLIAAKRKANSATTALISAASRVPFSPGSYINAKRDLADANDDIKDLEAMKTELF